MGPPRERARYRVPGDAALTREGRPGHVRVAVLASPLLGRRADPSPGRHRLAAQCEGSEPVSRSCRAALESFSPTISTLLCLRSYLVVMASRAATVEASQMWESVRSMTTRSGSSAYRNRV